MSTPENPFKAEIEMLRGTVADLSIEVAELQGRLAARQDAIDRLRATLAERDATIATRDERIARFEAFAAAHEAWEARMIREGEQAMLDNMTDSAYAEMLEIQSLRSEAMPPRHPGPHEGGMMIDPLSDRDIKRLIRDFRECDTTPEETAIHLNVWEAAARNNVVRPGQPWTAADVRAVLDREATQS